MFTANPWVAYVSIVSPLLAIYYLLIGLRYYRQDIKVRILHWRSPPVKAQGIPLTQPPDEEYFGTEEPDVSNTPETGPAQITGHEPELVWENEEMMQQLEKLSVDLKQTISDAHQKSYNKEDLILLLQMTVREYNAIYGTPFQLSINTLIDAECERYGSINLNSEDRIRVWDQEE
jgi:hypothetical protein